VNTVTEANMSIESFLVRKELRREVQRLESRVRLLEEQIGKLMQPSGDEDSGVTVSGMRLDRRF
jgi:hypothetical protein